MKRIPISRVLGRFARTRPIFTLQKSYWMNRANIFYCHAGNHAMFPVDDGHNASALHSELKLLQRYFHFISLDALLNDLKNVRIDSAVPVATLTFDDGLNLFKSGIFDVLSALSIPATVFVVTSCIDNRSIMWNHKLRLLLLKKTRTQIASRANQIVRDRGVSIASWDDLYKTLRSLPQNQVIEFIDEMWESLRMPATSSILHNRPYLDWADLDRWAKCGHQIGIHSATHPICGQLSLQELETEFIDPARTVLERFSLRAVPLSFPFGERPNTEGQRFLRDTSLFSCFLGIDGPSPRLRSPYDLGRMNIDIGIDDGVFGRPLIRAIRRYLP